MNKNSTYAHINTYIYLLAHLYRRHVPPSSDKIIRRQRAPALTRPRNPLRIRMPQACINLFEPPCSGNIGK